MALSVVLCFISVDSIKGFCSRLSLGSCLFLCKLASDLWLASPVTPTLLPSISLLLGVRSAVLHVSARLARPLPSGERNEQIY